jgi:hypothetical protein
MVIRKNVLNQSKGLVVMVANVTLQAVALQKTPLSYAVNLTPIKFCFEYNRCLADTINEGKQKAMNKK